MEYLLRGDLCYSENVQNLICKENAYLYVKDGICIGVYDQLPPELSSVEIKDYSGNLILPGMVDLHLHAPQYGFRGTKMDLELLDWLNVNTFPEESKYEDLEYAKQGYQDFVKDLRESATTRAVIFATLHKEATLLLMKLMEESGLVSYVGKVNMDRNSPEYLTEHSAEESLENTRAWLSEIPKDWKNCKPILTPRFTPTCSDALMEGLGKLAEEYSLPIQSHLSENQGEIAWVKELCPTAKHYGDTYDRYGLLENSIMAHCVYSEGEELSVLKERGTMICHCPQSNTNLCSGVAPIRRFLKENMKVGLGTDVAGGANLSMLRAITDAISVSKLRFRLMDQSLTPLTLEEAFCLATLSGGSFFGKVGSFLPGYEADILIFREKRRSVRKQSVKERLEVLLYTGEESAQLQAKYVQGRKIFVRGV